MKKKKSVVKRKPDRVINGIELYNSNARELLSDPESMSLALNQCMIEGDWEAFQEIFLGYLAAVNKEELSRKSKVPIATIRRMAAGANFNINNYFKVMKVLSKKKIA